MRDLPDLEALEDAGLLSKDKLLAEDIPIAAGDGFGDDDNGDLEDSQSTSDVFE